MKEELKREGVLIGKYFISSKQKKEQIYIGLVRNREGGQFKIKELEKVIDKFYKENF